MKDTVEKVGGISVSIPPENFVRVQKKLKDAGPQQTLKILGRIPGVSVGTRWNRGQSSHHDFVKNEQDLLYYMVTKTNGRWAAASGVTGLNSSELFSARMAHPITASRMFEEADRGDDPFVAEKFRLLGRALRKLEQYLAGPGWFRIPPNTYVAYRTIDGQVVWNLEEEDIKDILAVYSFTAEEIGFVIQQIHLHESYKYEGWAID